MGVPLATDSLCGTRIFAFVYVLEDYKSVFNFHTHDCNNSSAFPVSTGCNLCI